jgi:DNA transposition AAA+ family ATPase
MDQIDHAQASAQLRDQFNAAIKERGISVQKAATQMGMKSSARLSQWAKGKYGGRVDRVETSVTAWLARESGRTEIISDEIPFVKTTIAKKAFDVARKAHVARSICLLVGPSGVGKTRAMREYATVNPDVIMIECHKLYRARDVISDIHRATGLDGKGTVHVMVRDIVERLKGNGRLIIIDEAENLNATSLDEIRRIHDWAGVGILYVGLERFYAQLRGLRGDYEYLVNRVRARAKVERLTEDDARQIIMRYIDQPGSLVRHFHEASNGVARLLITLIVDSMELARAYDTRVTPDIITAVVQERGLS